MSLWLDSGYRLFCTRFMTHELNLSYGYIQYTWGGSKRCREKGTWWRRWKTHTCNETGKSRSRRARARCTSCSSWSTRLVLTVSAHNCARTLQRNKSVCLCCCPSRPLRQYLRMEVETICFHECDFIPIVFRNTVFGFHSKLFGTWILKALALATFASAWVKRKGAGGRFAFFFPSESRLWEIALVPSLLVGLYKSLHLLKEVSQCVQRCSWTSA